MALSFLEPPLTSYCISDEIQELTSSAPLCFSDLMAFYPLTRKLSHWVKLSFFSFQCRDIHLRDDFCYHLNRLHILTSFSVLLPPALFFTTLITAFNLIKILFPCLLFNLPTRMISSFGQEIWQFYSLSLQHSPYCIDR